MVYYNDNELIFRNMEEADELLSWIAEAAVFAGRK